MPLPSGTPCVPHWRSQPEPFCPSLLPQPGSSFHPKQSGQGAADTEFQWEAALDTPGLKLVGREPRVPLLPPRGPLLGQKNEKSALCEPSRIQEQREVKWGAWAQQRPTQSTR